MRSDVSARIEREIGAPADNVEIHDDPASDALARARGADAVTIGEHMHFRQGSYRPDDPRGFALLVHETVHAVADSTRVDSSPADLATEEYAAERAESRVLTDLLGLSPPDFATPLQSAPNSSPVVPLSSIAAAVITALPPTVVPSPRYSGSPERPSASSARSVASGTSTTPETPTTASSPAPAHVVAAASAPVAMAASVDRTLPQDESTIDIEALRRNLFHDLKRVMRDEFERGA
jgi:hypothetical protein